VDTFTYQPTPGRVVFGRGASRTRLAAELEALGARRVLLLSDARFADRLDVPIAGTFTGVRAHVPAEVAAAALAAAQEARADWLLSIGGGSTTGAAKAVALELGLPIAAVPTTYAGSEMTPIYGMTDGRRKRTGVSPDVLPRLVVYDPDLLATLPPGIAAASAMNAMAHAVEALYGPGANPVTALIAEGAIRALAAGLDADDPVVTLRGAFLAASALAVGGTGLHHKICHVLGGSYDLPHAELHAIVLPHALAVLRDAHPAELARAADALGATDTASGLHDLLAGLPGAHALAEIGLRESDLAPAAALLEEQLGLDRADALRVLEGAYAGTRPLHQPSPTRSPGSPAPPR
jgi:maleylacetate reductase